MKSRSPIPGHCIDIDNGSWHKNGQVCESCGFGLDDYGDGKGAWNEPIINLKELPYISHRDFEVKYLGGDTREKQ